MAEPARKLDDVPSLPRERTGDRSNITDLDTVRREREQAQRLQEQKQLTRSNSASPPLPAQLANIERQNEKSGGNGINDKQRAEIIDSLKRRYQADDAADPNGSKRRTGLNTLHKAQSDLKNLLRGGRQIGLFGYIMLIIMGGISLFLDTLPLVTGDLVSIIDWIFDVGFYFMLFITMVVMTGELMRSMFGFRGVINLAKTILEFIPASDLMPWHTLALIVLCIDVKYDIVKIVKNLGKGGSSLSSGEAP